MLPSALQLAALCTSIDNIQVVLMHEYFFKHTRYTVSVLKSGNWEKRLLKRCARVINMDIDNSLKKNPNVVFYVYAFTSNYYRKNIFFMCVDLGYDIK